MSPCRPVLTGAGRYYLFQVIAPKVRGPRPSGAVPATRVLPSSFASMVPKWCQKLTLGLQQSYIRTLWITVQPATALCRFGGRPQAGSFATWTSVQVRVSPPARTRAREAVHATRVVWTLARRLQTLPHAFPQGPLCASRIIHDRRCRIEAHRCPVVAAPALAAQARLPLPPGPPSPAPATSHRRAPSTYSELASLPCPADCSQTPELR